ncbi:hypothetical protein MPNT_40085 [Candidatus Methylacidithermus pantelleriae]|uniref:Uncharacterized protein n=1 Tax=Candidatus Methylacidithermus pantelleriae TaxID=2744239 RepID=A0A8J2BM36_9BACT|nr:hypothetical protein MPNT_40085 [Candidatus Methylacidithermus pantelleriae]
MYSSWNKVTGSKILVTLHQSLGKAWNSFFDVRPVCLLFSSSEWFERLKTVVPASSTRAGVARVGPERSDSLFRT